MVCNTTVWDHTTGSSLHKFKGNTSSLPCWQGIPTLSSTRHATPERVAGEQVGAVPLVSLHPWACVSYGPCPLVVTSWRPLWRRTSTSGRWGLGPCWGWRPGTTSQSPFCSSLGTPVTSCHEKQMGRCWSGPWSCVWLGCHCLGRREARWVRSSPGIIGQIMLFL